jgi:general secretion pathway protein A
MGFIMVTGEIGTGKTTICRALLSQLDPDTELAFIFNPCLNPVELLKRILTEFGVQTQADTLLDLTDQLNEFLLSKSRQQKNCVLVIDEAQNLTPSVLEQIRLLSNLETEKEKLLQIVLIGQPELLDRLKLHELRQLNQRITARYHLNPLDEQETKQYIAYRIHIAGGKKESSLRQRHIKLNLQAQQRDPPTYKFYM